MEDNHRRNRALTLAVDFDGTITDYRRFRGRGVFDAPFPGAREVLQRFKDEGWKIIIYSTRGEVDQLAEFLRRNGIPFDEINQNSDNPEGTNPGKPIADVYLDDRAVSFTGDWEQAYRDVYSLLERKKALRGRRGGDPARPAARQAEERPADPVGSTSPQ